MILPPESSLGIFGLFLAGFLLLLDLPRKVLPELSTVSRDFVGL
jgi:hypothetical protein